MFQVHIFGQMRSVDVQTTSTTSPQGNRLVHYSGFKKSLTYELFLFWNFT